MNPKKFLFLNICDKTRDSCLDRYLPLSNIVSTSHSDIEIIPTKRMFLSGTNMATAYLYLYSAVWGPAGDNPVHKNININIVDIRIRWG